MLEEIQSTGNTYNTNISILHIDENPSKKTDSDVSDETKIGENIYYIEYTKQVEEIFNETKEIRLSQGDFVKIDVENINETMHQMIQKTLYKISGGSVGSISAKHTVLILESTEGKFAKIIQEGV